VLDAEPLTVHFQHEAGDLVREARRRDYGPARVDAVSLREVDGAGVDRGYSRGAGR
jgi:hypothetical protein